MSKLPKGRPAGGKRPGAGRKPDWLRAKCAAIIDQHELIDFVGRVAAGEETEQHMTKEGDVIDVAPPMRVRLDAVEFLCDRAHGKPQQAVELTGRDGGPISWNIVIEGVKGA